jgi:multidrug efflux pump subunit AcrB
MAFVIMIGIPTSFVMASTVFYNMGYTINLISLVGVLLALGIIVDDAIVVSEHIQQYVEDGIEPKEAAIKGATEMVLPVTIASVTTLFAFLPSLMISGTMGEVIKLIPIALSALIIASLIETFIFLPIHAAHTLKKDAKTLSWDKANIYYSKIIHFFMRWKKSFLVIFIIFVPVFTFMIIKKSHFQMFPEFDSTIINIALKADVNTPLEKSNQIVTSIVKQILTKKQEWSIKNVTSIAGYRKDSGGNSETYPYVMSISLELYRLSAKNFVDKYITPYLSFYYDDKDMLRQKSSQEISAQLQQFFKENDFKNRYNLLDLSVVQKKVGPIKADVKIGLVSSEHKKVQKYIQQLKEKLRSIKGVVSAADSTNFGIDELKIKVNQYGYSLGIDEGFIGRFLANEYLNIKKSSTFTTDNMIDIKVKSLYKDNLDMFRSQLIWLPDGKTVSLNQVCELIPVKSLEKITKENGETNFYIFSNVNTKIITASEVLDKIKPLLDKIREDGVKVVLKGEAQKNEELKNDMKYATSLAMILILLAMLYLFNSFKDTFMVMSVIPFSLLGVLIGHQVMEVNLGMTTLIGALGLAGVVINDGIIMMTYLKKAKNIEDIFNLAAKRFRPIILTTVTTLIGISSLIFFPTGQAVLFQPMAIALGFGLAWGTVLNLIYLPVIYTLVHRLK